MLCWFLLLYGATIRVRGADGQQAASARPCGAVWQSGRVTSRYRGCDQRVRRLRWRSGVWPSRDPCERLHGAGHRREARGWQKGLPAASSGLPGTSGIRLRLRAAAEHAEDRSGGEGVLVVLRPCPGREMDADLGARNHAVAGLALAAPSRVASAVARRAGRRDRAVVRAAARGLPPAPVDL